MKPEKFVCVHLFNDRSGSPKVLSQVVTAMRRKGIEVDILTSGHTNGFLSDLGCRQRKIFYKRSENKFLTLFYYIISQIYLFITCLLYSRADVTFYINTYMPFGAAIAAKIIRKNIIYHIHETSLKPKILKKFLRLVAKYTAQKIIFVSKYTENSENFGRIIQKTIYNAITQPKAINQAQSGKFTVLMLCSLKRYKGVYEYIKIADNLKDDINIKFTLVLNATTDEVDSWKKSISLPCNIEIFARQSDTSQFYCSSHLIVNLSRPDECIETFGLTLLEGMSYSLPVIAPPVGGPSELIKHGKNGYLISCYETGRISKLIGKISKNNDLYKNLSNNAKKSSKNFSIEKFEENILNYITSRK